MEKQSFKAFLRQNAVQREFFEYVASDRFVDENGDPIPFKLKVLTTHELEKIKDKNTENKLVKGTGKVEKKVNEEGLQLEMVLSSVIYPDLQNEELQLSYGAACEEELLKLMLTPGEYVDLSMAIGEACGFKQGMADKIKFVKNF